MRILRLRGSSIPIVLSFGLGLAFLTALSLLSFWELQTHRNLEWIADMQGVAVDLQELIRLMREAEKAQRLYLLTGNDDDLNAYEEAASGIPKKMARLNTLTGDYPFPRENLEHWQPWPRPG